MIRQALAAIALGTVAVAMTVRATPEASAHEASSGACTRSGVETLVRGILRAFNRGDLLAFESLIADEPAFMWFSVTGTPGRRIQARAFDRKSLPRYVSARHRQGERQRLVGFSFNGRSSGYGHFAFTVIRSARDHPAERVVGKGAVDCSLRPARVAVWSLGDGLRG